MYSKWLKIDLHIHTDKSRETKENDYQGNFSVGTLHNKLVENNVQIFSLTDHNIINVDAYTEYYNTYNNEDDPLLLLGVELDIEGTSRIYHSLLIFNYSTKDKAIEINNRLEEKYTQKGIADKKQRKLTIDEIVELFPSDDFFFIPHAGNTKSIVDGHRGNIEDAQKMVLLMQSAFEKVPEKARQKYNEGFDKVLFEAFQNKDDIAYIEFSDNHNIEQYPKKHKGGTNQQNHEFYYIKGSKNYETIRLAFIDPKSRIKSPQEYNQIDQIINKIEKIKIDNEPNIESTEIFFSPHLNVIIGGRSSGKSLLMNVLGRKIDRVAIENHYKIKNENFLIKSKDDDNYKEQTTVGDNILYVKQGDIVRYFEHNDLKSLAKDSNKIDDYERVSEEIRTKKDSLKEEIDDLINTFGELLDVGNQIIYELHRSTIQHIFSEEYVLNLDEDKLYEEYINSKNISEAKSLADELYEKTKQFKANTLYEFKDNEKKTIDAFLALVKTKQELMSSKEKNDTRKSDLLQNIKALIDIKNSTLSQGGREKTRAKENRDGLIQKIKIKFQKAVALKKQADKIETYTFETEKIISMSDDVDLVLCVEEDQSLKDIILSGAINNTEHSKSLYLNLLGLFNKEKTIKNLGGNSKENLSRKINTVFSDIYRKFDNPKDYLRYSDGTTSKENSPGLNSEKYLEVVLENELIKMVFIDQPEDNLGNKFISHTLVDIIRNIKFQKQIFLVTHNPAIAVYGDAECIIIAENNDNKISYKQIVLEDKNSQKEICSILDGGEYIFDNRSRKYNIQRILREAQNV